jgi:hypothetical protein
MLSFGFLGAFVVISSSLVLSGDSYGRLTPDIFHRMGLDYSPVNTLIPAHGAL